MPQRAPPACGSDMPLPGKLLLPAAALLLLSLAFRWYRNRSPPGAKIPPGEQRENRDGDGDGDGDGDAARGLRRRRAGGHTPEKGPGMGNAALRGQQRFPRAQEEEKEGEKGSSEPGLIPSKAPLGPARSERELGSEQGRKLGWKLGIKSGSKAGIEPGSDPGSKTGRKLGSELGSQLGSRLGNNPESEPGSEPGSKLVTKPGSEQASEPGVDLGNELGSELGMKSGSELGSDPGSEAGSERGSEPGSRAGIGVGREPGILPGSELGPDDPGAVAGARSGPAGRGAAAPSSGRSPGSGAARTAGDGRAQSPERGPAGREEGAGTARTLSVTSSLGLLLTASEPGADCSYSFSSVAKIQVEENFIPERRDKDGDSPPGPGLRGKVYDYFVQSVSESVSRKTSLPFIPAGQSRRGRAEPRSFDPTPDPNSSSAAPREQNPALETPDPNSSSSAPREQNPALGTPDPDSSSGAPREQNPALGTPDPSSSSAAPGEALRSPPEPPSPGWKSGSPGPAEAPQLPGGGGEEAAAGAGPARVRLGSRCAVLSAAEARGLRAPRDAALRAMSAHLLQVLRSPELYGRLNAGERELLPRLRARGRPRLVVADVPPAEPGHGHGRGRLCYYDEDGDRWCHLCQLPAEVAGGGCAVSSLFNYLFVVPGCEGAGRQRGPSRRVLCYDPLSDSWRDICPLRQARPRCRLVALDGHLYAIGGECLATVERYEPRRDRWAAAAPLPGDTFAVAHAAAACAGDIFVTGGTLRSLLLRYDPRGDSWATGAALGDRDGTAELVSAGGFLHRFQLRRGPDGSAVTVSRCSASARLWYRCASRPLPDPAGLRWASRPLPDPAGLRCAALGSLIHCLGRDFHLRFLADPVSPRFGAKELRPFPAPHGSLLPAVLVLPEVGSQL